MKKLLYIVLIVLIVVLLPLYLFSRTNNTANLEVKKSAKLILSPVADQVFSMSKDVVSIKWDTTLYRGKYWVLATIKKIGESNKPWLAGGVVDVEQYKIGQIKWGGSGRLDVRSDDVAFNLQEPGDYELTLSVFDGQINQGPDATPHLNGKSGTRVDQESVTIRLTK